MMLSPEMFLIYLWFFFVPWLFFRSFRVFAVNVTLTEYERDQRADRRYDGGHLLNSQIADVERNKQSGNKPRDGAPEFTAAQFR